MTIRSFATALMLVVGLAACANNPDRFGGGAGGTGALGPGGVGGVGGVGPASDPSSQAYFQSRVGDRVLFEVDQHTLSPQARTVLDAQAQWLVNNPEYRARIEGHADEQGTREYNFRLSERRATSAYEYLVSRGVSPTRLSTVGYGKERPIEACSAEACYSQNRRAVTVVSAGLTG